jgi:hypothetical protein
MTITLSRRTILIAAAVFGLLLLACVSVAIVGFAVFSSGSLFGSSEPTLAEYQECVREERTRNPNMTYGQQIGLCGLRVDNPDVDPDFIHYVCGNYNHPNYSEVALEVSFSEMRRGLLCRQFQRGEYELILELQP